ncbi:MAG TPA: flagellar basal body-associated protein FliL [Burkholderiales bacterium]|jgi:flagellar FliL protein|nr:flagellar basal body-associated protein FliL [Burkholderiales bacterium]
MATSAKAPSGDDLAPSKKYDKLKKILIIVAIALASAAAAGAGVYFMLLRHGGGAVAAEPPPPVFFALDSLTVNLNADDGEQHYLRLGLTLKLPDTKAQEELAGHMPEIRSRILLLLSNKTPDQLATVEGKQTLANELRAAITEPSDPGHPAAKVDAVLFTDFVVQ